MGQAAFEHRRLPDRVVQMPQERQQDEPAVLVRDVALGRIRETAAQLGAPPGRQGQDEPGRGPRARPGLAGGSSPAFSSRLIAG